MKMNSLKWTHKYTTGNILIKIESSTGKKDKHEVVKEITEKYENHPSVSIFRNSIYVKEKFKYQFTNSQRI